MDDVAIKTKLADLNPEFKHGLSGRGYLAFDCPVCGAEHRCLNLPTYDVDHPPSRDVGNSMWGLEGSPPDWNTVTLDKEVRFRNGCNFRGFLTNGEFHDI